MSNVKMVKQWVAEDGSTHETRRAAEENAMRMQALDILNTRDDVGATAVIAMLVDAGLMSFKVKQPRKPRVVKPLGQAPTPPTPKTNGAKKVAA